MWAAFISHASQNESMHMKVLTWTKWLGISLHIECICPLMMGMILASGRLTCDNLEEKHVKTAMIIFPSLILFTNLKYTGLGKVIKWLKMWLNWPNTFWGHCTYLSKKNNNNKCMYTDRSGVLEGLESPCGGRKNSDMLSRNRIKPRLKQVRSTVVKSGLKKKKEV